MVKVLCRGGPHFWIREPYTEFEEKMEAADAAKLVREKLREGRLKHPLAAREQAMLDDDPKPTKVEWAQWREHYPDELFLLDNEAWPLTEAEMYERWAKLDTKHITFYGGAPHRPSSPRQPAQKRPARQPSSKPE